MFAGVIVTFIDENMVLMLVVSNVKDSGESAAEDGRAIEILPIEPSFNPMLAKAVAFVDSCTIAGTIKAEEKKLRITNTAPQKPVRVMHVQGQNVKLQHDMHVLLYNIPKTITIIIMIGSAKANGYSKSYHLLVMLEIVSNWKNDFNADGR